MVLSSDLDRVSFVKMGYWVALFLLLPAFLFSYFAFFRFCTRDRGVSSGRDPEVGYVPEGLGVIVFSASS